MYVIRAWYDQLPQACQLPGGQLTGERRPRDGSWVPEHSTVTKPVIRVKFRRHFGVADGVVLKIFCNTLQALQ